MFDYSEIVDRLLESDDYKSVLSELKNYFTKSFNEFAKTIQGFDERLKNLGVETRLDLNPDGPGSLKWYIKRGYMDDPDGTLYVKRYVDGTVDCDKSVRMRVPGSTNANDFADANQLLQFLEGYVEQLEQDEKNNSNNNSNNSNNNNDNDNNKQSEEDRNFTLDPAVKTILDNLKTQGESVINRYLSVPALNYNGKNYKLEKGTLYSSTEKEVVACFEFPRSEEIDIYDMSREGLALRNALVKHFSRTKVNGKSPEFRYDMEKTPYFYVPVGKLPVKKSSGPEARAMLNYYDGNKVRFQPKEKN